MKNLVIIGAGAMGRETFWYVRDAMPDMNVKGFLDSRSGLLDGFDGYPPILDSVDAYDIEEGDVFVPAIGDPVAKLRYSDMIRDRGGEFVSVVHPSAYVAPTARVGIGSIIAPHAVLAADAVVDECVILNVNASVSHDCAIGRGTSVSPGCSIAGRCKIHDMAFIGTGASILPDVELGGEGLVYVGAGAVVTRSFGRGLVAGVPAEFKREVRV